jgi:hypothetical protein
MSAPHYPARLIMRARALRAAGWTLDRIADLIADETGQRPYRSTIHRWVDPDADQRGRDASRRWQRRFRSEKGATKGGRLGAAHHTDAYQDFRACALLAAGLPAAAVARVMAFDYPSSDWTLVKVRQAHQRLRAGREPNTAPRRNGASPDREHDAGRQPAVPSRAEELAVA